jgi:hypothetical protein
MKGADPHGKNAASEKAVDRFQRWQKSQQQRGLPTTQGESAVHNFLQTHNPIKKRVGPKASDMIHRELGLNPDSVKTPRAKPVKAVNPTLKGKGGKTPAAPTAKTPAPKAAPKTGKFVNEDGGYHTRDDDDPDHVFTNPRNGEKYMVQHEDGTVFRPGDALTDFRGDSDVLKGISKYPDYNSEGKITVGDGFGPEYYPKNYNAKIVPYTADWNPDDKQDPFDPRLIGAGRKTASFFTRKVSGWRWDDHLNGYLSKEARAFTCACGERIAAPSYKTCACGKVWNVYAIGDSHHLASDTADVYIAREIEVRPGVIMANRRMAGDGQPKKYPHNQNRPRPAWADEDLAGYFDSFPEDERPDWLFADPIGDSYQDKYRQSAKDGECTCWEGYERVPGTEPCASKSCRKKTSNRKLAGEDQPGGVPVSLSNNGGETWNVHQPGCSALNSRRKQRNVGGHEEAREFPDHKSVVMDVFPPDQFDYDPDDPKWGWKYYKKYVKLHDCMKGQIPEDVSKPTHTATRRAQATFKQYLAEINRLADWTKYDGPDPTRDPKAKPPSTTIKSQPGDWTNRDFTGPTKGQWREPELTELPRKTRKKK